MKIIKETLTPFMKELEKQKVEMFSVAMFFSSYVKEMLKDIDDEDIKEVILRNMLD